MTPRPAALPDWTPTVAGFYRSIKVPMHDGSYEWTKAQAQAFFASDRCHKMEALGGRCFVMPAVGDDDRVCIFVMPQRRSGPKFLALRALTQPRHH
jgi:hypothetical protein